MAVEESATFSFVLRDEMTASAAKIAGTLTALKKKISDDSKALSDMQRALRNLKGSTSTSSDAFKKLQAQITAQKAVIASSQNKFLELGGTFTETRGRFAGFIESLSKAPGPLGMVGGRVGSLLGMLGTSAGPIGLAIAAVTALVTAYVALAAAALAAAVAVARFGLAAADARRNEALHFEGLSTLRTMYGQTRAGAGELQSAIDRVSASSVQARGEIAGMAEGLSRLGLRGGELTDALEGLSIAQAVQGDRGAARFRAMVAQTRMAGGSVAELTAAYRQRLGPIATRMGLGLEVQMRRLHESLSDLFRGVNIEGFLVGLNEIVHLFSQTSATGYAIRTLLSGLLNPLFSGFRELGPIVHGFFGGFILAALDVGIVVLRIRNYLRKTFGGGPDTTGGIDSLTLATRAGALAFGLFAVSMIPLVATIAAFGIALQGAYIYFAPYIAFASMVADAFSSVDLSAAGISLIDGLVRGLRSGYATVTTVVRGLAGQITREFQSALGIHSPSRVFAQLGLQIPRGVASGVEHGAPEARGAVSIMAASLPSEAEGRESPFADRDEAPVGGAVNNSASATSIGPINLTVNATSGSAEDIGTVVVAHLTTFLEGLAITRGAPA